MTYIENKLKNSTHEISNPIDWNSVKLLLLLTGPASMMAIILFLWPEVRWIAEIPFTAIGVLGAFTQILLSVFIIARYRGKTGIVLVSAGLLVMAVVSGVQSILPPESSEFIWLHSVAGILGSIFFSTYVLVKLNIFPERFLKYLNNKGKWTLLMIAAVSAAITVLLLGFDDKLPLLVENGYFTRLAWITNSIPMALYMFSGVSLFLLYRKTSLHELFLFTAVVIFLFQASEVIYLASLWSVIWWFWLSLRLLVYVTVLTLVLREYIQTSSSLAVEIEERNQIEKALRKAEEDWRNSFNSLEEVMIIFDAQYRIENINTSGLVLLNKKKTDVLGKKINEIFPELSKENSLLKTSLDSGKTERLECYDTTYKKYISIKCSPIMNEKGRLLKYVYLMEDITEKHETKEKEKLLQKELNLTSRLASIGEVAAGITHEINNPLTSVIAFAQLLSLKKLPEDIKEAVDVINDGAGRIANIVEKLLTFARRHKPDKEYVDINSIISSVVGMRSYEMKNNNIDLIAKLSTSLPKTMANVGEIQQVLLNVIINAEQAIKGACLKSGKIIVESACTTNKIRITVSDNGPGISEEHIDKLFDPFFTTKDESGGTGLGLSISYGIIKEHGGKIYTENRGEGATFIIELPVVSEERYSDPIIPVTDISTDVSQAKILVVDDELHICRALENVLTREGHTVETFRVAEKALIRLQKTHFDLILFDIKMPGMDGIEFFYQLSQVKPLYKNRAICITGDIISTKNKEFIEKTGISFITKPFGIEELVRLVKEVLGGNTENAKVANTHR